MPENILTPVVWSPDRSAHAGFASRCELEKTQGETVAWYCVSVTAAVCDACVVASSLCGFAVTRRRLKMANTPPKKKTPNECRELQLVEQVLLDAKWSLQEMAFGERTPRTALEVTFKRISLRLIRDRRARTHDQGAYFLVCRHLHALCSASRRGRSHVTPT